MDTVDQEQLERRQLIQELSRRYGEAGTFRQRLLYLRKKYGWHLIVGGTRALKRILDILAASAALIVLSPLMLAAAGVIKLWDGGPIFYVSTRVGKWGREFTLPKFRTMVLDADQQKDSLIPDDEEEERKRFKLRHDPRVTTVGRFLRKSSIDELPQLLCVLRGDMSMVGPRPPLPHEVQHYSLEDRRRLDVRPGITCLWQVSGRSNLTFQQQLQLDREYIESRSLWLDLKLLLKTVPAVLSGRGAY